MIVSRIVMGNIQQGRRPYLQIQQIRYSSSALRTMPALIGQRLLVQIDQDDLSTIKAFAEDGRFVGKLYARERIERGIKQAFTTWYRARKEIP